MKAPPASELPSFTPPEQALPQVFSARAAERRTFVEESATALGRVWAQEWRLALHREGRPAAGGWPGTLREARMRVDQALRLEMSVRKMAAINSGERELAARTTYASARNEWRRHLDPEIP